MKILVQFSGGKDSQACLIKAVNDYGKGKEYPLQRVWR